MDLKQISVSTSCESICTKTEVGAWVNKPYDMSMEFEQGVILNETQIVVDEIGWQPGRDGRRGVDGDRDGQDEEESSSPHGLGRRRGQWVKGRRSGRMRISEVSCWGERS